MQTYYHTRHACGHSVYWSDPITGRFLAPYPCPYCGGEAGTPLPADANVLDMSRQTPGLYCFRTRNPDGTVPAIGGEPGDRIGIRHMTGNICCD